jgi:hypothetical protein
MSGDHTQGIWRQLSPASADDSGSWTESVLYAFQGLPIDGSIPDGAIALVHGSVYGSTEGGADSTYYAGPFNAPEGCGIIFQLTAPSTPGGAWKGLVAKRRDSKYEPGLRSGAWQKMRVNAGQELVIGGYTPSPKNFDALVLRHLCRMALSFVSCGPPKLRAYRQSQRTTPVRANSGMGQPLSSPTARRRSRPLFCVKWDLLHVQARCG